MDKYSKLVCGIKVDIQRSDGRCKELFCKNMNLLVQSPGKHIFELKSLYVEIEPDKAITVFLTKVF